MILIALLGCTVFASSSLRADQAPELIKVISSSYSEVRDVSFIYEGDVESKLSGDSQTLRFQGRYVSRNDGSGYFERYVDRGPAFSIEMTKKALLRDRVEAITFNADSKLSKIKPKSGMGGPGSLNGPYSPEYLNWFWYFSQLDSNMVKNAEFLGAESIDGVDCLKLKLGRAPNTPINKSYILFWIDFSRGSSPRQVEIYSNDRLVVKIEKIKLGEFSDQTEKKFWIPVSAEISSFLRGNIYESTAVSVAHIAIVRGSLFLNKGYSDSTFSLDSSLSFVGSPISETLRSRFAATKDKPRVSPPIHPQSVKEFLDKELEKADRQASELLVDASQPSFLSKSSIIQLAIVIPSIVVIIFAFILRSRQS